MLCCFVRAKPFLCACWHVCSSAQGAAVFLNKFEVLDQPDRMCIGFGGQDGGGYKEYRSDRVRCLGKGLGGA